MYQNPEPPEEMLACFNEDGTPIENYTRAEVHTSPPKYWHAVVNIWLVNSQGKMLCSKRAATLSGNPNKWQTYFGGHVKAGLTYREAAEAELEEEVGLRVSKDDLFFVRAGRYEPSKHFFENYVYSYGGNMEDLVFNDGEIVEIKWYSFDEYNAEKANHPEDWCNGCSVEDQELIKKSLRAQGQC